MTYQLQLATPFPASSPLRVNGETLSRADALWNIHQVFYWSHSTQLV